MSPLDLLARQGFESLSIWVLREKAIGAEILGGTMKSAIDSIPMTYSSRLKILPIAIQLFWLMLFLGITLLAKPEPLDNPEGIRAYSILLFICAGLSWILFIETIGTRVRVDDVGIHIQSRWRPARTIEWPDVKLIRHNLIGDSLMVVGNRCRIRIELAISDRMHWMEFLKMLNERVPFDKIQDDDIRKGILQAVAEGSSELQSTDTRMH